MGKLISNCTNNCLLDIRDARLELMMLSGTLKSLSVDTALAHESVGSLDCLNSEIFHPNVFCLNLLPTVLNLKMCLYSSNIKYQLRNVNSILGWICPLDHSRFKPTVLHRGGGPAAASWLRAKQCLPSHQDRWPIYATALLSPLTAVTYCVRMLWLWRCLPPTARWPFHPVWISEKQLPDLWFALVVASLGEIRHFIVPLSVWGFVSDEQCKMSSTLEANSLQTSSRVQSAESSCAIYRRNPTTELYQPSRTPSSQLHGDEDERDKCRDEVWSWWHWSCEWGFCLPTPL